MGVYYSQKYDALVLVGISLFGTDVSFENRLDGKISIGRIHAVGPIDYGLIYVGEL